METDARALAQFAEGIVKELVIHQREAAVRSSLVGRFVSMEVTVEAADRGRLIGRNGQVAKSIRTILDAAAVRRGLTCHISLQHDGTETGRRSNDGN